MPVGNRPTLHDVRSLPIGEIAALPGDQLALLQEDADAAFQAAKNLKEWIEAAIAVRYGDQASSARAERKKDAGTVRFEDGPILVISELPKRVEWDQAQLASIVERIRASGEDPSEYVEIAFKVLERKYGAWPAHIRAAFEPARTVRTGKQTFLLRLQEDS